MRLNNSSFSLRPYKRRQRGTLSLFLYTICLMRRYLTNLPYRLSISFTIFISSEEILHHLDRLRNNFIVKETTLLCDFLFYLAYLLQNYMSLLYEWKVIWKDNFSFCFFILSRKSLLSEHMKFSLSFVDFPM